MDNAFSINRLAEMFEHDRRRITRTLARVEPVATKGRSKLYTCKQYLEAFAAGAEDNDGNPLDLTRERALLARAQRRLTEQTLTSKQTVADDQLWQRKVIDVISLYCGLSMRQMGTWLQSEFAYRDVQMADSPDGLREIAEAVQGWGLGIAHRIKQDLTELAQQAETRQQAITEFDELLKLLGRQGVAEPAETEQ